MIEWHHQLCSSSQSTGGLQFLLSTWRILWPHNVHNKEREYLLESIIQVMFFFCSLKPPCIIHYCQGLPVEFKSSLQSRTLLLSRNYSLVAQVHNQNLFRWIETQIIELFSPEATQYPTLPTLWKEPMKVLVTIDLNCLFPPIAAIFEDFQSEWAYINHQRV